MADIAWSDVVAIAAQLSTVSAGAQAMFLADANESINVALFGGEGSAKTKLVRVYRAAHFGELARRRGDAQVTGETLAATSVSLTYLRTQSDDGWRETPYGATYLDLIQASAIRFVL